MVAVVNSGISSFYYARVVREVFTEGTGEAPPLSGGLRLAVVAMAFATVLLGLRGIAAGAGNH
ncbi:MAG: hypothetical protein QXU52_02070 [Fervidicoccaceae archaeon]